MQLTDARFEVFIPERSKVGRSPFALETTRVLPDTLGQAARCDHCKDFVGRSDYSAGSIRRVDAARRLGIAISVRFYFRINLYIFDYPGTADIRTLRLSACSARNSISQFCRCPHHCPLLSVAATGCTRTTIDASSCPVLSSATTAACSPQTSSKRRGVFVNI